MLFNSVEFFIFLPVVFVLYWFFINKNLEKQNLLLLAASYFFYGCWDWRFLSLIVTSSYVDYSIGIRLAQTSNIVIRKALLLISIVVNIGFLVFFKYFNFFSESFASAFTFLGQPPTDPLLLNVILPIGISFYSFQTLSYSIDVYRGEIKATRNMVAFFTFVSFFPQLVAGPIERATNLLPQFYHKRIFDREQAIDGMRQVLWGLFKKVVIADSCAQYVNEIFANYTEYSGSTLLIGAFLFSFQIYGDFSGYSDIAIGTARLFGFSFMENFAFPYFSRDIAEFWRRWHISLSTWFRDYVYIPLGGSRGGTVMKVRNTFIIFLVSGFWHGANWTFVAWGALHAVYFLPLLLTNTHRKHRNTVASGKILPGLRNAIQMGTTFGLVMVAWVFFRSDSIYDAVLYISGIFSSSLFSKPQVLPLRTLLLVIVFIIAEWLQRNKKHTLSFEKIAISRAARWGIYYGIVFSILFHFEAQKEFIYFQF
ncbi:MAG: MBOAT family O-acyltransferase [Phormidesmis sp.]